MLVLTRKPQQSVMIGDDIELTVIAVQGDKVRLGINAPADVPIFRMEIYVEIAREREREKGAGGGADAEEARSGRDEPEPAP